MTGEKPRLEVAADELDQVLRLQEFRKGHPGVSVEAMGRDDSLGPAYWMASWVSGGDVRHVVKFTLQEMLDKLDELHPPPGG